MQKRCNHKGHFCNKIICIENDFEYLCTGRLCHLFEKCKTCRTENRTFVPAQIKPFQTYQNSLRRLLQNSDDRLDLVDYRLQQFANFTRNSTHLLSGHHSVLATTVA